ncbi:GNAT family N-acetyltransferase [Variovorax guangxiensis]|uniref:GNAT family N-acetyltransferase n=1 Tax=Variovorax guangxiensis TaxID=1775474 RepID=A0A502DKY7_9BURK|nr:GNAT family N-acetyltransferase [Variovorax guangxiensis]TPG21446.1 GNAT family N-acetyltransferase [Variovorax ginsengisoli]TPG25452.1 GNAT family N-acetyltransferase [Variovorax guangxiensis]
MATVTVRQATILDLQALVPLFDGYRQFYGRPSHTAGAYAFLLKRFRHAESAIFLAHEGSEPVGFTQLYPSFSSISMVRIFILNDLFVREDARGKGVSKMLISAATDFARVMGAANMTLSTALTNTHAQAVYESLRWRRDEQFCHYSFPL